MNYDVNMKYRIQLFLLATLLSVSLGAQWHVPAGVPQYHTAQSSGDTLESALLWEIAGPAINTSYLFGTIHMIPAEDYFLPDGTEQAIAASEHMVFEIDLQEMMEDPMAQMGILMKAFMNDGTTLRDLLSDEDYAIVKKHFDEIGMPLFIFERVKPMFLSILASDDMSMDPMSMESTKSYEMEFLAVAESKGMSVGGLETVEFQISVFDSIPYEDQAEMLVESIQQGDAEGDMLDELIALYTSQDINALYTALGESDEQMMEYEDILVSGRNKNWIPLMEDMMQDGPVFFAVGAGHLAGEYGVINLLKQKGYILTPILGDGKPSRSKQRF